MSISRRQILALWQHNNQLVVSLPEITKALGDRKTPAQALAAMLDEMVQEGVLRQEQNRFKLPAGKSPAAKDDLPSHIEGIFSAHRNGFGFIDQTNPKRSFFVPPPYISGAMDRDLVRAAVVPDRGGRHSARIEAILRRGRARVRGYVEMEHGHWWVVPLNDKLPALHIHPLPAKRDWNEGALVEAEITTYPETADQAPMAQVVETLPEDDSPEGIIGHLLADSQVDPAFSAQTLAEMARLPHQVTHPADREDMRDLCFVTIDGEDAKDFDDAVCHQTLPNGHERLLVAIADVADYVRPGMAVDDDAYRRGTSIYLPDRVLPMLPEVLSNELCSLKPHVPRLALACDMELDVRGEVVAHRIVECTILSRQRLTYNQVQAFFDGDPQAVGNVEVEAMLGRMRVLYLKLRRKRYDRGALEMLLPELRFKLDENGQPAHVYKAYPSDATRLIEQFMLEANETVARHADGLGLPILFRVHEPPPDDNFYNLHTLLAGFGIEIRPDALRQKGGLNRLLHQIEAHPARDQIEVSVLRSMSQANYRHMNEGHYGLAAEYYTHFTSPIRRYPDLLLHRALKMALRSKTGKPPADFRLPPDAGEHLSFAERTAGSIESKATKLFAVMLMEPHLGKEFVASVLGVSEAGLWLDLPKEMVEGFLPMEDMPQDQYRVDRPKSMMYAKKRKAPIGFGQLLRVQLVRADRHTQKLEFSFVAWLDHRPPEWGEVQKPAVRMTPISHEAHSAAVGNIPATTQGRDAEGAEPQRKPSRPRRQGGRGQGRSGQSGRQQGGRERATPESQANPGNEKVTAKPPVPQRAKTQGPAKAPMGNPLSRQPRRSAKPVADVDGNTKVVVKNETKAKPAPKAAPKAATGAKKPMRKPRKPPVTK